MSANIAENVGMEQLKAEVLVVGGGTGGAAAAIQAARRGRSVVLVSEGPWLGGMLTSAGVCVPDGNELAAFQTGIWGQFLRQLEQRQCGGLDQSWVSCFCYAPRVGSEIFADWVQAVPNLHWIAGQRAIALEYAPDVSTRRAIAVRFPDYYIEAQVILDGTELGDLLALGQIPHRWGWEPRELWQEPSAPSEAALAQDTFFREHPVQSPTWVVILRDYGEAAPTIPAPDCAGLSRRGFDAEKAFCGAWQRYGPEQFLNYGRLPGDRFMLNWPIQGNDYGVGLNRLVEGPQAWASWAEEAIAYSQAFARYIQQRLGHRYGLAEETFPSYSPDYSWAHLPQRGGAYALQPYYRESRRLQGLATVTETDILPQPGGWSAKLPQNSQGDISSIAIGNYPNDHHYPGREISLAKKARRWGGRWTGTPFTIPYGALVPQRVDGLLVCEKNISVSHMANGATRLQPTVLGIGQAAGMAAALCVEQGCLPRDLPVRQLQRALLEDPQAPSAVVPFYDLLPEHPDWRSHQLHILDYPEDYPPSGECVALHPQRQLRPSEPAFQPGGRHGSQQGDQQEAQPLFQHRGILVQASASEGYCIDHPEFNGRLRLITLRPEVDREMRSLHPGRLIQIQGYLNRSGPWVRVERLVEVRPETLA